MSRQRVWFWGSAGERVAAAAAIAVSAAFLLCGYEFMRSVSQSLFVQAYGVRRLPWVMAAAPLGTLALVWGYGRVLSAVGARRAMLLTTALTGLAILACHAAIRGGSRGVTAALYVLREAYIVLLVEQVWSFINSTVSTAEGRRLNGPVCGVASLGAIAGGFLVRRYALAVGSNNLLPAAALSLLPTGAAAALAYRWGGEPQPSAAEAGGRRGHLGLGELAAQPTLRRLALLVVLTQVVSTALDLQLNRLVALALPGADERTRWFGGFYAALNLCSALFQFVLAPWLLRRAPLRAIHLGIPLAHLGFCATALAWPLLATAAAAYLCFKVLDYSVFRAAKELLYIPLSYDARYRSKELIDAFGYRFAKGAASLGFGVAAELRAAPPAAYALTALAALAAWVPLAAGLARSGEGQSAARTTSDQS